MSRFDRFKGCLLIVSLSLHSGYAMESDGKQEAEEVPCKKITSKIKEPNEKTDLADDDGYYSDSEDEADYKYQGLAPLTIPKNGMERCLVFGRGIHYSPSKFTREQLSKMRRRNNAGEDIYASAAYDLARVELGENENIVRLKAQSLRKLISNLSPEKRAVFQQLYSNQYDAFHKKLGQSDIEGIFGQFTSQKNPLVSTSENFFHSGRYAAGFKFLGSGVESLDPAYDANGKPKHPYLGKLFVVLTDEKKMDTLDPYFVVHAHANDMITISDHYSKNVLIEREVSFPGLIPGDCVVLSTAIRVPSFEGNYKSWYQEKFGISERSYKARKKILTTGKYYKNDSRTPEKTKADTVQSLLEQIILPHVAEKLKEHIQKECDSQGIQLVYKGLDGKFGKALPDMFNVSQWKATIKREKNSA